MRRVIAMIGMLAACDTVYGLHDRPIVDGSSGDDGTGSDARADGPTGPHDEDNDGHMDDVDVCPGIVDPQQSDADNDGIGDACDPVDSVFAPNHRLLFDPFTTLATDWTPNTLWTSDGESVGPDPEQPAADGFRLTHRMVKLVANKPWQIDVGIELPPALPPPTFKFIGTHLVDLDVTSAWLCAVYENQGAWFVTAGAAAVPALVASPVTLRNSGTGAMQDTNTCSAIGAAVATATATIPFPVAPQLWTQVAVRYQFIDVIQ